jgi:hypothetical protein
MIFSPPLDPVVRLFCIKTTELTKARWRDEIRELNQGVDFRMSSPLEAMIAMD